MAKKEGKSGASKEDKVKRALRGFVRSGGAVYLRDPNVTSIGVGRKNGHGEVCLVFSVRVKDQGSALEALGTTELPAAIQVDGIAVPTDVIERHYAPSYSLIAPQNLNRRRQRQNPIQPGISVSHINGSAGTLGGIVYDADTGVPCILSNWHVLHSSSGAIGDAIVQPGPFDDNNTGNNRCGTLLRSDLGAAGDCALACIAGRGIKRESEIYELGTAATRMAEVDLDDKVIKSGRTTAVTHGIVRRIHVMVEIEYGGVGMRVIRRANLTPTNRATSKAWHADRRRTSAPNNTGGGLPWRTGANSHSGTPAKTPGVRERDADFGRPTARSAFVQSVVDDTPSAKSSFLNSSTGKPAGIGSDHRS